MFQKGEFLDERLSAYARSDYYPFHMPGHKRNLDGLGNPYQMDITEIEGFDNLHHAEDILLQSQERLQNLYHSKRSYYLVNGSTCGLLSAIGALTGYGDKAIVARNCHKSVYNALKLFGLKAGYVYPKILPWGIQGQVEPKDVAAALEKEGRASVVVITSPTYEGIVSDIQKIADIVHKYHAYLIVDEAHGAHFSFSEFFPKSALECGADVVIHSLHKTLPCLTQSAALHVASERVDCGKRARIEEMLGIFQTSSPSYVLMAGIDRCVRMLAESGEQLFLEYQKKLERFYQEVENLKRLYVFQKANRKKYRESDQAYGQAFDQVFEFDQVFDFDRSKIVILTLGSGCNGTLLYRKLLDSYHLQMEMYAADHVIAMTSVMDTEEGFFRLSRALYDIDRLINVPEKEVFEKEVLEKRSGSEAIDFVEFVKRAYGAREKAMEAFEFQMPDVLENLMETELELCVGKICAEFIFLYPPGIPMIVPGERITQDFVNVLEECKRNGLNVQGTRDRTYRKILTVNAEHIKQRG